MTSKVVGQRETLQRIKRKVDATNGVLEESGLKKLLLSRMRSRFQQTISPSGVPWPGLLKDTVRKKKQRGLEKPEIPLWATGRLYKAIEIIQGSSAGLLAVSTGAGFRIGVADTRRESRKGGLSPVEYGRLHNYGITQVERRFIGLSPTDINSVARYINRRLKAIANV